MAQQPTRRAHLMSEPFARVPKSVIKRIPEMGQSAFVMYTLLCMHANAKTGKCWPKTKTLAEEQGISTRRAQELVKILTTMNLIERRGRALYVKAYAETDQNAREVAHSNGTNAREVALPIEQESKNKNQPTRTTGNARHLAREENVGWMDDVEDFHVGPETYGNGPIQHHPQQAARRQQPQPHGQAQDKQRQTNSGVSSQNGRCQDGGVYGQDCPFNTLEEEKSHPYWTPANVEYFKALIDPYPQIKLGEQRASMHAWRTVVGDQAADQAWADAWWKGLHDWIYKWQAEKTLEKEDGKWVPFLANFIRKKKWADVQQAPGR